MDNIDWPTLFWFMALPTIVFVILIIKSELERKRSGERSEALRLAAQALGLSFEQSGSIKVEEKFGEF